LFGAGGSGGGAQGYTPLNASKANNRLVSWDDDEDDDEEHTEYSSPTRNYGTGSNLQQVRQQQYDMIQEQDKGLEALSEVISRQKNLAQVIGNEVEFQNELIDDITDHVDRTRDRLIGETTRVRTIDRKDSTGRYWAIIILLLVIIIIITVV